MEEAVMITEDTEAVMITEDTEAVMIMRPCKDTEVFVFLRWIAGLKDRYGDDQEHSRTLDPWHALVITTRNHQTIIHPLPSPLT